MADSHEEKKDESITTPSSAPAPGEAGHEHGHANVKTYLVIFVALCIVTTISFIANWLVRQHVISPFTSFVVIMAVAVLKATLVAMYFMHLVIDWKKVYIVIVPTLILGPVLVIVLLPDIVLAWKHIQPPVP